MADNKLKKYLQEIAQNAAARHAHLLDPEAAMKNAKLTKKQRDMIHCGDIEGIQKEIGSKSVYLAVASSANNYFKKQ